MNGKLTGYYLTYYAIKQGDKVLLNYDVTEVPLQPNSTSYTITGLQPLSVYRVGVVASTAKGVGPKAITVGGKNVIITSKLWCICITGQLTLENELLLLFFLQIYQFLTEE